MICKEYKVHNLLNGKVITLFCAHSVSIMNDKLENASLKHSVTTEVVRNSNLVFGNFYHSFSFLTLCSVEIVC